MSPPPHYVAPRYKVVVTLELRRYAKITGPSLSSDSRRPGSASAPCMLKWRWQTILPPPLSRADVKSRKIDVSGRYTTGDCRPFGPNRGEFRLFARRTPRALLAVHRRRDSCGAWQADQGILHRHWGLRPRIVL